jgi:hypothetical protein
LLKQDVVSGDFRATGGERGGKRRRHFAETDECDTH